MGKKKGELPAKAKVAPKKPNPFELKTKVAKKFNVTGKRHGKAAGQKNVIKARQDAVDKRKKTLLVEYKQLRKANTFIDKRFGESDPNMSEDAKAMARLQEQRLRDEARRSKKKGGQKFVLGEHEEAEDDGSALGGLTHLGKNIADMDDFNEAPPDLDDLDDDMVQDLVSSYNFGGGGADGTEGEAGGNKNKTRKEVMEEIIAKSKMYKAIKARQREEDEDELDKLNAEFQGLVKHHALKSLLKPPGHNKGVKVVADIEADAAYDVAARALAAEARGAAGDRVLGPEEQAERERARMEMLEKERLRRMRGTGGDEDVGPSGLGLPEGGYAARRLKLKEKERQEGRSSGDDESESGSGDEGGEGGSSDGEGEEEEEEEEEEGVRPGSELEKRRMEQAAGDHPLQNTFRSQAAQLLQKYGMKAKDSEATNRGEDGSEDGEGDSEEGEVEDEGSDLQGVSGSEMSDEGGSEEDESGDGEEEGEDDGMDDDPEQAEKLAKLQQKLEKGLRQREQKQQQQQTQQKGEQQQQQQQPQQKGEQQQQQQQLQQQQPQQKGEQQQQQQQQQQQPQQKGEQQRQQQQQQQQQQLESKEEQQQQRAAATGALDLHGPLDLPYTIKMPDSYPKFAALVRGRSAEDLATIISRIRGFNATALASDSKRGLQVFYGMLIQHFAILAGERPVPLAHLDAMVPLLLPMTAEVPFYAATVARARLKHMHERLSAALAPAPANSTTPSNPWPTARTLLQLKLLTTLFPVSDRRHPVITPAALLVCKYLSQCVAETVEEVACGLLLVGLALHIISPAQRYSPEPLVFLTDALWSFVGQSSTAAPASTTTTSSAANGIRKDKGNGNPKGAKSKGIRNSSSGGASTGVGSLEREGGLSVPRVTPGVLAPSLVPIKSAPLHMHAARFEDGFSLGRDYDPDRERAEQRKLKRMVQKERRGALRELRKDATFMADVRDKEKAKVDTERMGNEKRFYNELQSFEANMRSGGQGGMNPHLKKRKK
ncbi:nucleolar protein 14 [Dunaliella salina]|uniref:Nucleolar protein 14 n=1 Tax=Dunaliella salina TaxID=3046 RepID=A0ABQ7GM14_DUNSA|nr:nucleolar protein 14 [Dunaliella salina]|eukprot:KAF5835653.1 nucleolar protein 14 [Dunaliella salina]